MNTIQAHEGNDQGEILYCWAIGDLHYRALPAWNEFHSQRLAAMFDDLHTLWQEEGQPAFCVSPGDLIETCAPENYQLARSALAAHLGEVPLYPGIGNHEYFSPEGADPQGMAEAFTHMWGKPVRYSWQAGDAACIMLDYPNPATLEDQTRVFIAQETLAFLDAALTEYASSPALIFLHCPLHNTVLDRDEQQHRDYNSLQHFFAAENSQEVRDILARHKNACLLLSGHTHSGWEAPGLVTTEQYGDHAVTFVNLMSPWYTGTHTGPRLSADLQTFSYTPDEPNIVPTFAIRLYPDHINIRVREHLTRQWLKEWNIPIIQ